MRRRLTIVLLVASSLLVPATSHAGRGAVTGREYTPPCDPTGCAPPTTVYALTYDAAPGEVNTVTVERGAASWTIRDATAPVEAGPGCEAPDPNTLVCGPANADAAFSLGDGPDSADARSLTVRLTLAGGEGDDVLRSGGGADVLDGGGGADVLEAGNGDDSVRGGGGEDVLRGGVGNDRLSDGDDPAAPGGDTVDGGAGFDTVDYSRRIAGVAVDLARPAEPQGQGGEGDRLAGVEGVLGGAGDDFFVGTAGDDSFVAGDGADRIAGAEGEDYLEGGDGDDRLQASEGDDTLLGGDGDDFMSASAGNDDLDGGRGKDVFLGGPGNDEFDTRDGVGETVTCSRGKDRIEAEVQVELGPGDYAFDRYGQQFESVTAGPDAADVLGRDCELVYTDGDDLRVVPRSATATLVVFSSPCFDCRGSVRIRAGSRTLGSARFKAGARGPLRVPVRGLRRRAVVSLSWSFTDGFGDPADAAYRMALRR